MPTNRPVDLIVIGSGPAGQRGAIQAAKLGKRVVLVEKRAQVGGVSVHTGTIPSKTLREAVLYLSGMRQRGFYGRGHRERKDLKIEDVLLRLQQTVQREVDVVRDQLQRNQVEVLEGSAEFLSPHRVRITSSGAPVELTADKILLAPGTEPHRPGHIPFDGERVVDSDGVLCLTKLPKSMVVVGSGVIGLEYASIFQALDVRVTLIDERDTLLDFMDREIIAELTHALRDRNMALRLGEKIASVKLDPDGRVTTQLGSGRSIVSDVVLFAAGRCGATAALNLSAAGLSADSRGRLTVDAAFRTSQPHIYAAGDVIGFPSLASTSMEQGRQAMCHAFGQAPDHAMPVLFPFGIYAVPEMSMVGATEEQLRAKGIAYEVGIARFRELARGQILGVDTGLLKILVGIDDHKLLGVHILGEGATELIHVGQMVIGLGGTLDFMVDSVFNYPTLAEAYKVAALDAWNRMPKRIEKSEVDKLDVGMEPLRAVP